MQDRRARTRRLIELGGLVQKSGLPARLAALRPRTNAPSSSARCSWLDRMLASPNTAIDAGDLIARWRAAGRAALRQPNQTNTEPTA